MITIPVWLFVLILIPDTLMLLFVMIYFIAGLHDLYVAEKVARKEYDECPYFIDKDSKK